MGAGLDTAGSYEEAAARMLRGQTIYMHEARALGSPRSSSLAYRESLAECQRALQLYLELEDQEMQARAHACVGDILAGLEDYPAALAAHQQALRFAQATEDLLGQADSHSGMAFALESMGRYAEALQSLHSAHFLYARMKDFNFLLQVDSDVRRVKKLMQESRRMRRANTDPVETSQGTDENALTRRKRASSEPNIPDCRCEDRLDQDRAMGDEKQAEQKHAIKSTFLTRLRMCAGVKSQRLKRKEKKRLEEGEESSTRLPTKLKHDLDPTQGKDSANDSVDGLHHCASISTREPGSEDEDLASFTDMQPEFLGESGAAVPARESSSCRVEGFVGFLHRFQESNAPLSVSVS